MSPDLRALMPETILACGAFVLLVLPSIKSARVLTLLTLTFLIGAFDLKLIYFFRQPYSQGLFYGMSLQDPFGLFFQMLIFAAVGLVTLSMLGYSREQFKSRRELYALVLLMTVGLSIVVGAQHLAVVYIGLEIISIFSYLLTGFLKKDSLSIEGALKYFLFGSLATGVLLYGISLVYGLTGTMDLPFLTILFPSALAQSPLVGAVALLFILVGLGFKVALVPFHMWAPDAYEGAPTPVAALLSVGPKAAGLALLARVLLFGFSPKITLWPLLLGGLALLTMTVGNVAALVQTNVKRLLAYSSIAHAGTMVIGLAVATPLGLTATLYYLVAYLLMNLGAFVGVIAVGNATGREDLGAFSGLSRTEPVLAFLVTLSFLSLAGIPPMAGFFAKMWIFGAALKANAIGLAVGAALNSVIALFYYMAVVKAMYLEPLPRESVPIPRSRSLQLVLLFCTLGLFIVGLYPGPWLSLIGALVPLPLNPGDLPWM